MNEIYFSSYVDKALAILLLLLVIFSGFFLFNYVYLNQITTYINEIELGQKKYAKINSIISNQKEFDRTLKQEKSKLHKNLIFLKNSNPATAASELQNYVKRIIAANSKAKVLTIKPYPVVDHDDYFETSLEIRLKAVSHNELQKLLYRIESNKPLLLVREVDVKRNRILFKSLIKNKDEKIQLNVNLIISGFFKGASQ